MIRMYISYLDKNSKSFCLDFLTLQSISSTKSEVIIHKIKEVLLEWGIDISRIGFVCFDGTKAMSSEKTGVQQGYRCEAPFSIYVNCQCHRLTLCFKLLVNKFPWLSEIDKLFLGSWITFHYSSLNYHIFLNYNKHMIYSLIIWLKLLSLVGFPMDKHVKVRVIRPNSSCPRWNNFKKLKFWMGKLSIKFINLFDGISNIISWRYIIGNIYLMFNTSKQWKRFCRSISSS